MKIEHTVTLNLEFEFNELNMSADTRFPLMSMSEERKRELCEQAFIQVMEEKVLNYLNENNSWATLKLIKENA